MVKTLYFKQTQNNQENCIDWSQNTNNRKTLEILRHAKNKFNYMEYPCINPNSRGEVAR